MIRRHLGEIKWDTQLIEALAQETGMSQAGLKWAIRDLARKLGMELPRYSLDDLPLRYRQEDIDRAEVNVNG